MNGPGDIGGTVHPSSSGTTHPEPALIDHRDPVVARAALEELGRATWEAALDWLYDEAMRRPISPEPYLDARRRFFGESDGPSRAPQVPTASAEILAEFRDRVAPSLFNAQHPGAFSYFTPPPLPMSIAGEVLAQWTQQGVDVWHAGPVAAFVEEEVTSWLRDLVGAGIDSWGVLTSGGVMANLMAMTVMRDVHVARIRGAAGHPPRGAALEGLRVYASDQAHFSIARALSVLGFPDESLVLVQSDEGFRLRADAVADAVRRDRAAGLLPVGIAAVAGSTNTGSVDDVPGLAEVARAERLWLHVDAAYGGAALLSPRWASALPGLDLADSVTIDPHKWFFQAYDIGALVVRRRSDLLDTFHREPEYYRHPSPEESPLHWYQYSLEGTRRFRALKLWMSWKHLGTDGFARLVDANMELTAHLDRRLRASGFEVVPARPELSVICFRAVVPGMGVEDLDALQERLQRALETSGIGWVSTTTLRGRRFLRAGIVNYLSTSADADAVVGALAAARDREVESAGR